MNRREFISTGAGAVLAFAATPLVAAQPGRRSDRLGIGMHSYSIQWSAVAKDGAKQPFSDALSFLEYARDIGAGGVQVTMTGKDLEFARKVRAQAESCNMYFEGQLSMPKDSAGLARFELEVQMAKEAGAQVLRTAFLSGRRYETFDSAEAFARFHEQSWKTLTLVEPILKRHRLCLAIENHKDWFAAELVQMLRRASSEFIGACVDIGNNIALLEDPLEVLTALAPYAFSTHIKDMGVEEYADGFLLSEVPLGDGFLELKEMIGLLRKANPGIHLNLEMITRDPLKIPCLLPKYWLAMGDVPASRLANTLALVKSKRTTNPLPRTTGLSLADQLKLEDTNVRRSIAFAKNAPGP